MEYNRAQTQWKIKTKKKKSNQEESSLRTQPKRVFRLQLPLCWQVHHYLPKQQKPQWGAMMLVTWVVHTVALEVAKQIAKGGAKPLVKAHVKMDAKVAKTPVKVHVEGIAEAIALCHANLLP